MAAENEQKETPERPPGSMSLMEHLVELRTRLVRSGIAIFVGFGLCYGFSKEIFAYLMRPLVAVIGTDRFMIFTSPAEAFVAYLKVGLFAGVFLASPSVLYQIWKFIAPGLFPKEKRTVVPFVVFATLFFISGAAFCYFVIFPYGFGYLIKSFESKNLLAQIKIEEALRFATKLMLAFGITFEMPVVIFFLARIGLVSAAFLWKQIRYAIIIIAVIAAVLSPPDAFSMIAMSVPLLLLYILSIGVAKVFGKKKPVEEDEAGKAAEESDVPRLPAG